MVRYVCKSHAAYFLVLVSSGLLAVPRQDMNLGVRRSSFAADAPPSSERGCGKMKIKLYKYMPAQHALEVLRSRMIKVSTALDANDPNEMIPNYIGASHRPLISSAEARDMFRKSNLEKHAFVSLSQEWDNNVMWGVYGDKFTGMTLVFDIDLANDADNFFPVSYSASRMILREQESAEMFESHRQYEIARRLFAQKDKQWSFEQEWRRCIALKDCESKKMDNGQQGYFVDIDKYFNLTGVLLGPDCKHGIGAVQCAMRGHEWEEFTCTILCHDIESYAVRIAYREQWRRDEGWKPYSSFVI